MLKDSVSSSPKDPQGEGPTRRTHYFLLPPVCMDGMPGLTSRGRFPLLRAEMACSCPLGNPPCAPTKFENK